jgi:hypothetical protein
MIDSRLALAKVFLDIIVLDHQNQSFQGQYQFTLGYEN